MMLKLHYLQTFKILALTKDFMGEVPSILIKNKELTLDGANIWLLERRS